MRKTPLANALHPVHWMLALTLLALAGCTGIGPLLGPSPAVLADQGQQMYAQQNYAQASVLYQRAAHNAQEPQRSRHYLMAARAALRAGDKNLTLRLLERVNSQVLGARGRADKTLTRLSAQTAGVPAEKALQMVSPPGPAATPQLAAGIWKLRADLLLRAGQLLQGVHALVQRRIWLLDPDAMAKNSRRIWQVLQSATPEQRQPAPGMRLDHVTQGWVALAHLHARFGDQPDQFRRALALWSQRYPDHPALRSILAEKLDDAPQVAHTFGSPRPGTAGAIALALPLSGELAGPANAILDGFLAAYYQTPTPRPALKIYDTQSIAHEQPLATLVAQDGASILVGPLTKTAVTRLAAAQYLPVPVLALNYTDTTNTLPALYQFGLSPEDEARAVARRAVSMGWLKGIALVPQGEWGRRVIGAFEQTLSDAGGELVEYAYYDPAQENYAEPIKQVLNYGSRGAEGAEGTQPNRADFIFIAAQPTQARLLRTQLRFFHATSIPVLATSHLYAKSANGDRHGDLNQVMFADMPWVLGTHNADARKRKLSTKWDTATGRRARLFAMGLDAWALAHQLRQRTLYPGSLFQGATGKLYLQQDGQIRRQLDWAQFSHGKPQLLPQRDVVVLPGRRSPEHGRPDVGATPPTHEPRADTWNPPGPIGVMPKPRH